MRYAGDMLKGAALRSLTVSVSTYRRASECPAHWRAIASQLKMLELPGGNVRFDLEDDDDALEGLDGEGERVEELLGPLRSLRGVREIEIKAKMSDEFATAFVEDLRKPWTADMAAKTSTEGGGNGDGARSRKRRRLGN